MLIEFFGLPGTGKSTMSRLVADLLLKRGLVVDEITYDLDHRQRRVARRLAKFTHVARYIAAHPRYALSDLVRVTATRQATLLDLCKSIFNWMFIASLASRKRSSNRITFLDQGIAQAMWSIGFATQHENSLDLLLADLHGAAKSPDLIIHVRANFQTIGDRLAARKRRVSRLDALGRDQKALQRAETHGDTIMGKLRSSGIPIIKIENNDRRQLVSGARLVAGAILTMLNDTPPLVRQADRSLTDDRPTEVEARLEGKETSWQTP
jgi:hypothetical protein